jgi:Tol biopolymer transport system component
MRSRWFALLALLVLLAGASCGQVEPELVPEKSEVWHWPRARTQREVKTATTVGHGDRVWTEEHGRALLKWPDLWVRLYDDTQLQVEEYTASDTRLAVVSGTALNGGVPRVKERVTWTTSQAEIILTGTTVMASYHPGTQFTIVRVFDGLAEVRNLMGDVQTEWVRSGEWALVKPRQAPQVSDRLEEMRGLARDLGLWDVFHEVELDVQGGFGPTDSRVPPENVVIVFEEEQEEPDLDNDGLTNAEEEDLGTDPNNPDTDGDDLWDGKEVQEFRTNPLNPDSDADGVSDGREAPSCTDPLNWDTDGDGRGDGEEMAQDTDPCDPSDRSDPEGDNDGDGLTNAQEWELGTDPYNPDSDGDELSDGEEVLEVRTNPLDPDSDADGLSDGREAPSCTDPLNWDTDGDERGDGEEVAQDTDPCDPNDRSPGERDNDGDGLTNSQEWELGTNPEDPDTDGDALWDGEEVQEFGTDPLKPDSDEDGLQDGPEASSCTGPLNADTDGDGWGDGEEVARGTDPCKPDIEVVARPDLIVEILSIDKQQIVWREQPWSSIRYRVCNAGDGEVPAGPAYVRAWRNGSPTAGAMGVEGPLQPGTCRNGELPVGHDDSWPPNEYTVQLEIDYGQLVEESDESNNMSRSEQFIVVSPEPETTPRIVFVSDRTGNPQIWVMNVDGSNQRQLTQKGSNRAPDWSPDNRQIFFETDRDGNWGTYTMNADGTGQRPVEPSRRCVSAGISSKGQLSYACYVDGNWELFVEGRRITYNDSDDRLYTWSPLGDRIVFEARGPGSEYRVLTRVYASGEGALRLTGSDYLSWNVAWSPTAERLAFASNREGNARVFTMLADGTNWQALTSRDRWSQLPTWSPDGRWISFVSSDADKVWSLYRIDTSGYHQIRLSQYAHPGQLPCWSPDSSRLAFAGNADGDFEILVVSSDGKDTVQLTRNSSDDHSPRWSH